SGGEPLLLTKGAFIAEHIRLSPDGRWLLFSANTGPGPDDQDRRHIARTPVDKAAMEILTPGKGIESFPVATGDMTSLVMISATPRRPSVPAVMPFSAATGSSNGAGSATGSSKVTGSTTSRSKLTGSTTGSSKL